jgi:cytochrome c556
MIWLDRLALEQMRPLVSDVNGTKANQAEVLQQAEQIAVIAQLLLMPNMDGHDDENYAKHAREMKAAALEVKAAYTRQDYAEVGTAVNRITQSCDACHEDFR